MFENLFGSVPAVDATAARELAGEGALLLDVREIDEWHDGHAPGAVHVPLGDLTERLDELPSDRRIVAVCRSGNRSAGATQALRQAGYDAVNMRGGMQAWERSGGQVVRDDGRTGFVA